MKAPNALGRAWLVPLAACIVVGSVAGAALGVALRPDERGQDVDVSLGAAVETATFYLCPEVAPLGTFHWGDRVWATGRDESGTWIEVRAPFVLETRVWVAAADVEADESFADLPTTSCEPDVPAPPTAPSSTAVVPSTGAEPTPVPTEVPPTEAPPTGPEPTTSPTEAPPTEPEPTTLPDANPPAIATITAEPSAIWEQGCIDPVATVTAVVEDDRDVAEVRLSWSVGATTGSALMRRDGIRYVAEVGDFAPRTVDPAGPGAEPIRLRVTATDIAGNTAERSAADVLVLYLCD